MGYLNGGKDQSMKERSRTEYSLINIFTGLLGYGLNTLVGFICRIIFVRTLSADYLGVNGLFSNILSMLSLAELGIGSAITYALYKPIAENDEEKIASLMQFYKKAYWFIGTIVAIAGLLLLPFLDVIIREPPDIKENLYLLYLLFLFSSVSSYFYSYKSSLLTAVQRNYIVIGYNYIVTIVQSIFQIAFLLLTHEYISYLMIQVVGGLVYNIWISYKASKDYPYINKKEIKPLSKNEKKELFINIKALTVNKLSGVLVNSTDNIVITFFNGVKTVGFASNYTLFSSILNTLITQIFNALTGSVGNLIASSDKKTQYGFFKILNLANFWLYGWAAIGMTFVSSDLVQLFYGEQFVMGLKIPLILALNFYSIGMIHASYTYKSTMGLFKYGQYILIFTGILNILLDMILGKFLGVFGIYLATLISRLLTNLWYEPYAVYKHGLKKNPAEYFIRQILYAIVLFLTGLVCWMLCRLCNFGVIINILIKIVICSVIPNVAFCICFWKTEELQYLLERLKDIIGKIIRFRR